MNSEDKKPADVVNELENIRGLLDDERPIQVSNLPELDQVIPVLEQSIPELNDKVNVAPTVNVSLNMEHTTETVEQQLSRTHYEHPGAKPTLAPKHNKKLVISVDADIGFDQQSSLRVVNLKADQQPQNIIESLSAENIPLTESVLDAQQRDLENEAVVHKISKPFPSTTASPTESVELLIENSIIQASWVKVERLIMDHLPAQLAGSFLSLLNTRIDANKQQLIDELSLLDEDKLSSLLESLNTDKGF